MTDRTPRPFGVEQEHFVFRSDGSPPSHSEIDAFYDRLRRLGFQIRATDSCGRILAVERGVSPDRLVVCNDSCSHLLEAAFPVFNSLSRFRSMYIETWDLIETSLDSVGLRLHRRAVAEPHPQVHWRPKETDPGGIRLASFLARTPLNAPLYHRDFPAWFAATHVSLTVPDHEAYRLLPRYYAYDFLSPLAFSNSGEFQGVRAHCVRPLAWFQNFPENYPLVGIPRNIPENIDQYEAARQASYYRDYGFVSIRGGNRLEFRSTCSQNSVEDVIDAVQLRLAIDRAVNRIDLPASVEHTRSEFLHVAETGTLLYPQTLELLQRILKKLDSGLPGEERLLHRIESQMKTMILPHA